MLIATAREILQSQILANAVVSKDLEHFLAAFLLPFFFILFFSICARACVCVRALLTLHPIPFLLHSIHGTPQYRVSSFLLPWHPAS